MFNYVLKNIFGTSNDRIIKSIKPIVHRINALENKYEGMSEEELSNQTQILKERHKNGESLDSLLIDAFATVREASKRVLGMRHFDVQLIGGIILHRGMIAEMKTGEGKTLVATLAVYLNALSDKGVHVVTVNDYLAKRDSDWMGQLYRYLGLSVGCIVGGQSDMERKYAYECDITYGTNNEFGFDFLRDNLKYNPEQMSQKNFNFAIVDEVDSILIDEARTPLIISGASEDSSELYLRLNQIIPILTPEHYDLDEKARSVLLTDLGNEKLEELLKEQGIIAPDSALYDYDNMTIIHHANQALKAYKIFNKDVDYIVQEGKVKIIDEFTGRIMDGRRYSDGLHQALEAKESVPIESENQTLASITFQNYFRMYPKLAGMTGTAMTEADEFSDIYKLEVISIPTHVDIKRIDEDDDIYITAEEKYDAMIAQIQEAHEAGQPVLVGTTSIEKSEYIAILLKKHKIPHNVLNARYHEKEAEIIAQAGDLGAVTIATNMAGRGTDIKLGGNLEVMFKTAAEKAKAKTEADLERIYQEVIAEIKANKQKILSIGGLLVIGSERHESRRIDNQLRGRAGRQGDPGRTKFYLSMEDDLMRIFGSEKIKGMLGKLGIEKGEAISHPWISKSLEKAQQKVEGRNYDIRKNLLRFDDVMNEQRKAIYSQRKAIMTNDDLKSLLVESAIMLSEDMVDDIILQHAMPEEWDLEALSKEFYRVFGAHQDLQFLAQENGADHDSIKAYLKQQVTALFDAKFEKYGVDMMQQAIKQIMLLSIDQLWKEHLHTLDHLRTGIGLRAYAQKDPLNEYKIEAFEMFKGLLSSIDELCVSRLAYLEISHPDEKLSQMPEAQRIIETKIAADNLNAPEAPFHQKAVAPEDRDPRDPNTWGKVARNENCPCNSGKKYKHCHGAI